MYVHIFSFRFDDFFIYHFCTVIQIFTYSLIQNAVLEIRRFSSFPGYWLQLPLKKAQLPAPGSRFYKFHFPALSPNPSKKALTPGSGAVFMSFYRLRLLLRLPIFFFNVSCSLLKCLALQHWFLLF